MKNNYRDSLEADVQLANTLALNSITDDKGGYIQLRLHFGLAAAFFSFLFPWKDCKIARVLGLIHVIIYTIYGDGKTMHVHVRKASIGQFYEVVFPSIMQLQRGITDLEEKKQKAICLKRYTPKDESDKGQLSKADVERETECGICMETNAKVVLPNCNHSLCLKCYNDWHGRSKSCPFCRESLKEVKVTDLWICIEEDDIIDTSLILKENSTRLLTYIEKLPLFVQSPKC